MSVDVQRELTELAGQARQYADAAAVLRAVRRRRRMKAGTALALVAVAVVSLPVVLHVVAQDRAPRTSVAAPSLPAVIDPPAGPVPDLPTDHGVGASALVYQAAPGGPTYLVAQDATQYRVPITPLSGTGFLEVYQQLPVSLSPNGRWLVTVGSDTIARDLTSAEVRHLGSFAVPQAWSSDGRWLIHAGWDGTVLRDVESDRSWPLSGIDTGYTAVPDIDGRVFVPELFELSRNIRLKWSDPVHGGEPLWVPLQVRHLLGSGESVVWHDGIEFPDGSGCSSFGGSVSQIADSRVLVGIFEQPDVQSCDEPTPLEPVDYAVVSAATGQASGRLGLPAGAGAAVWFGEAIAYPTQASVSARIEINLISASGQRLGALTSLPPGALFTLAGATLPATGPAVP